MGHLKGQATKVIVGRFEWRMIGLDIKSQTTNDKTIANDSSIRNGHVNITKIDNRS